MQNPLSSSFLSKIVKNEIYRTLILPVVLYGCETWSHTLRKEHRLRVFENRVLRRILSLSGTTQQGSGEDLHKDELYDLFSSTNILRVIKPRRMRWE
jgi:hypothetical protein